MFEKIKQDAMEHMMKLLSNPRVSEFMSDPRVMKLITKGFELKERLSKQLSFIHDAMALLKQKLS